MIDDWIDDCRQARLSAHGGAALYAGIEKVEKMAAEISSCCRR
jgi:hypothetical protein